MSKKEMIAEIDLMDDKKLYVVKDGALIVHDLPSHGEVLVRTHNQEVRYIETKTKREV